MTNEVSEQILARIRALLNVTAAKGATEPEAAVALTKAQELLERYNLSIDNLPTGESSPGQQLLQEEVDIVGNFNWKKYLIDYIADHNMCKVVLGSSPKRVNGHVVGILWILGRQVNVQMTREMSEWITFQLERIATVETARYEFNGSVSKQQWRNSFLWGAISRINQRMGEARRDRHEVEPSSKALVLARDTEVDNYFKQRFPRTRTSTIKKNLDFRAYRSGVAAGNKVSLLGSSRQVHSGSAGSLTGG